MLSTPRHRQDKMLASRWMLYSFVEELPQATGCVRDSHALDPRPWQTLPPDPLWM